MDGTPDAMADADDGTSAEGGSAEAGVDSDVDGGPIKPAPSDLPEELVGVDLSDPEPASLDLSAAVTVAGPRVLVESMFGAYPGDLRVVDLTLGAARAAGRSDFYRGISTAGDVFISSGADASSFDNISVLRFTPTGFLPQVPVAGYSAIPGNFYREGQCSDPRFAVYSRRSADNMGIEVVDLVKGKRHGAVEDPLDSDQSAEMAPSGYYFSTSFWNSQMTPIVEVEGWSKITKTGVSPLVKLVDSRNLTFSGDGKFLFFAHGTRTGPQQLFVSELPRKAREVPLAAEGYTFNGGLLGAPLGQVYAQLIANGSEQSAWYLVDSAGKAQRVTDAKRTIYATLAHEAGALLMLYGTQDPDVVSLELTKDGKTYPLMTYPVTDDQRFSAAFAGKHVQYLKGGKLHLVGVDASGTHDVMVQEGSEGVQCIETKNDVMTFHTVSDQGLVFVDLRAATAKRSAKLPLTAGAVDRGCPIRHRTQMRMLYRERTATKTQLWWLDFGTSTIGTPSKRFEEDTNPDYSLAAHLFDG